MESQDIEKQIQELDEWIKSNLDSRELKRALGVKLALQGWTYRAIGEVLNVSTSFISKWKKRFQSAGLEGVKLSYQGDLISHLWGDSKERFHIPVMNEKNRQTYYGALNLCEPELILGEYKKGDGEYTVDFVSQ